MCVCARFQEDINNEAVFLIQKEKMTGIKVSKKRCVAGSYPCHTTYRGNRAISDEPFKVNSPEKEVSRNPTFRVINNEPLTTH